LSGSIRGGRELQAVYQIIHEYLNSNGYQVLDEHVASINVLKMEESLSDTEIYSQDIEWLHECDAVIAEVTIPSLGVGYEIAYSLHVLKKPVLGLYNKNKPISVMILGNTSPNLHLYSYNDKTELLQYINNFLKGF